MSLFRYLATDIQEETKESNIPQTITKATMIMINSLFIRLTTLPTSFCKKNMEAKTKMRQRGSVSLPREAFTAVLKLDSTDD